MLDTLLRGAVILVGVALCAMSAAGIVSPKWLVGVVLKVAKARSGMFFAVMVRLVLGAIMILAAPSSRFPAVFQILGWLSIAAAALLPLVGRRRMIAVLDWFAHRPPLLTRVWLVFGIALGAFLVYGVSGPANPPETPAGPGEAVFRGRVIHGHEVRAMMPCGKSEAVWVRDSTGQLWSLLHELAQGEELRREVFAVVRGALGPPRTEGFGADYPGELTVSEILYVASEGFGCDADWDAFRYRAMGNEPFWGAFVSDGVVRLTLMGEPEQVWTEVEMRATDRGVRYTSNAGGLILEGRACRDTMSGAFFGLSATLELREEKWTGCALAGNETANP